MWTWLGIAVLARVLMASNEVGSYQSGNSLSDQISEDGIDREQPQGEELTIEGTAKPGTKSGLRELDWKSKKIFEDINPYENSISSLIGELGSPTSKIRSKSEKELDDDNDEREKRFSAKQSEPTPPGSWMSWMTLEDKAMPLRDLQDPWQEIKKSRAFSPWGGKRVTSFGQGPKVRRPIRIPFNSWGGKRSFFDKEKRGRFSSWGGKRSWQYLGAHENSENEMEKRTKFNAWGGKRSKNGERDDEEIKRNRFNAWGGKRSGKPDKRTPEEVEAKKSVFNAWGGKRFFAPDEVSLGDEEKGLRYGGWKGKGSNMLSDQEPRDKVVEAEYRINNLLDEKYGKYGKAQEEEEEREEEEDDEEGNEVPLESEIIELSEKKDGGGKSYLHKSLFNPWGGKKRAENYLDDIGGGMNLILPESHQHHTRFWPWGG